MQRIRSAFYRLIGYRDRHGRRCQVNDYIKDLRTGDIWRIQKSSVCDKYYGVYGFEETAEYQGIYPSKYFIKL